MFTKLIIKAIRRPIATSIIFISIVVAGLFALFNMPVEIYPSVEFPRFYIITNWPGASPYSVESEVTSVIEGQLASINGISKIKSFSHEGYSQIELHLHRTVDVKFMQFYIQEKLIFLLDQLPAQVQPPRIEKYVPEEFKETQFMSYHIVGPMSDSRLREIAVKHIKPVLISIPGVAGAEITGGRERQIQIIYDDKKMQKWGLYIHDINRVIRNAVFISTIGEVVQAGGRHYITMQGKLTSKNDIERLPILHVGNRSILIGDVSKVIDTFSPIYSLQRINGQSTLIINIKKEPQKNTISVANNVYKTIYRLQDALPSTIRLIKEDDQSVAIRKNIRQLFYRAAFSFIIIFIILTIFLRYLRFALIIQAAIIISVLFAVLLMFISNYSLNLLTLAGLVLGFGFLVDNSIVVLESIFRNWELGIPQVVAESSGAAAVVRPLIASTLTTIAAVLPFLYLAEELRLYYSPFAVTVSISLIVSLIVSFFLIPTVTSRFFLKQSSGNGTSRIFHERKTRLLDTVMHRVYASTLKRCLAHPLLVVVIVILIFGLPFWKLPDHLESNERNSALRRNASQIYNRFMESSIMERSRPFLNHILGGSLYLFHRYVDRGELWRLDEHTYVRVNIRLPSGTLIDETDKVAGLLESTIMGMDGINQIKTLVYSNYAYLTVDFLPEAEYSIVPFIVEEKLIYRATQIGNARVSIFGSGPGYYSGNGDAKSKHQLILKGYNYSDLQNISNNLVDQLNNYSRVRNIRTDLTLQSLTNDKYENIFEINRFGLAAWRLTANDAIQQIKPYLSFYSGRQRLRLGNAEVPFAIHSEIYNRINLFQLQNHAISNYFGQIVPIEQLFSFTQRRGLPVIERENQQYYKIIAFDYLATYSFAQNFIDNFLTNVELPIGNTIDKQDYFLYDTSSKRRINLVLVVALLLMYMILAGLYESFSYPLLIFIIIPLSLIGVFLIYYFTDTTFNQSAYIGVIFLFGIVLNNGIILLDKISKYKIERRYTNVKELIVYAGQERLRPILMTTFTTVAGLSPLIILSNKQNADDIWYTLSLSTIGGLVSATILGLFVLPVFVLLIENMRHGVRMFIKLSR